MKRDKKDTPREYGTVAGVSALKALAHEGRLAILSELRDQPKTASDVARALGLPAQKVGYHIKQLLAANLVRFVASGRKRWKEERYYVAEAKHFLVDPSLACDDATVRQGLSAELEVRFQHARLAKTLERGLSRIARRVVSDTLALQAGSRLLILSGPFTLELADAILGG